MTHAPSSAQQVINLGQTLVANIASNLNRLKHPALRAEDGATFHGYVKPMPGHQYQAICWATLDDVSGRKTDSREHSLQDTENEARNWIAMNAASRGFAEWHDENLSLPSSVH
jgi:hypothetical protein